MGASDWDPDWDLIQNIYQAALDKPESERTEFIAEACQHDPALVSEITSRLAANNGDVVAPANLVGKTIDGRYLVENELAQGAMGRVYLARDRRLDDRQVVVKVLLAATLQNPDVVQRFKQEAVVLSRIKHQRVVGVLDAGEVTAGIPYIVMEYVEGESLRPLIQCDGMDLKVVANVLKETGDALAHVHQRSIFHRDLKPENIMVEQGTESIKIVDFGIAKVKDSTPGLGTAPEARIGTLAYMSPERLRGEESTAASDVYSLAVIAYEMITGRRPFYPNSAAHLVEMQRQRLRLKPIDLRAELSPKAQSILLRALSYKPSARYENAKEFGDDLARALLEKKDPPISGRQIAVIATVLVSLALLSFGLYYYRSGSVEPAANHSFDYWLTVQQTRDGQDYEQPFKTFGEETFGRGDKFQLNVSGDKPGFLYVFNQGPPETDNASFRMVYPRHITNNGSASVGANQPIQSDWIVFRGPAGAENFWIVWSVSPVSELEAIKTEALKDEKGRLTEQTRQAVHAFLKANQSEVKVRRYKSSQTANVRGSDDILIVFIEFKHR